jgi:hypothetical protein
VQVCGCWLCQVLVLGIHILEFPSNRCETLNLKVHLCMPSFTDFEVGAVVINTHLDFNINKRFGKKIKRA